MVIDKLRLTRPFRAPKPLYQRLSLYRRNKPKVNLQDVNFVFMAGKFAVVGACVAATDRAASIIVLAGAVFDELP